VGEGVGDGIVVGEGVADALLVAVGVICLEGVLLGMGERVGTAVPCVGKGTVRAMSAVSLVHPIKKIRNIPRTMPK
jgi:hypothetical protein